MVLTRSLKDIKYHNDKVFVIYNKIHVSAAVASLTVWLSWISVPALGVARAGVSTCATMLAVVAGVVAVVGRPHRPVLVSAGTGEVGPVTMLTGTGQRGPLRFLGLVTWLTPRCAWGRSGGWGLGTPSTLRCVTTSWFGGFKGCAVGMAALPGSPRFLWSFGEGPACDTSGPHKMTARCGDLLQGIGGDCHSEWLPVTVNGQLFNVFKPHGNVIFGHMLLYVLSGVRPTDATYINISVVRTLEGLIVFLPQKVLEWGLLVSSSCSDLISSEQVCIPPSH